MLQTAKTAYAPTDEDRLWLLRAVAAEGAPEADVASALVSRFLARRERGWHGTLADHVRAYAQPVNPRWFPDGDLQLAWHAKDPARYPMASAARRRDVHSARSVFAPKVVSAVDRALQRGPSIAATDYAAQRIQRKAPWVKVQERPGENTFWLAPDTLRWTGYTVVPGVVVDMPEPAQLGVGLALIALAWWLMKRGGA